LQLYEHDSRFEKIEFSGSIRYQLTAILVACLALAILALGSSVGSHVNWGTLAETGSAIFTALFRAILAWVGFRQEKISRSQADIAGNQLELMKQQTDISLKQKEIARQGQLAMHRPRLAVRNVVLQL
jgi:hypothetical protein